MDGTITITLSPGQIKECKTALDLQEFLNGFNWNQLSTMYLQTESGTAIKGVITEEEYSRNHETDDNNLTMVHRLLFITDDETTEE